MCGGLRVWRECTLQSPHKGKTLLEMAVLDDKCVNEAHEGGWREDGPISYVSIDPQ